MKKLQMVAAVAIATATFGLAASSAFAAVEARVSANGPHTFAHGVATVDLFVGSDLLTDASLSVTLTQVHRSATKVEEIRCFGDDLVDITFRRFHPGEAFVEATLTACDVNNPTDCDTGNLATEITFVRG
jgi:hypothetical protein